MLCCHGEVYEGILCAADWRLSGCGNLLMWLCLMLEALYQGVDRLKSEGSTCWILVAA